MNSQLSITGDQNTMTPETATERTLEQLQAARDTAVANLERWNVTVQELQLMLKAGDKNLRYANLTTYRGNLSYADLSDANLSDADLSDADLRAANLSYANLRAADLRAADLRAADLRAADLRAADLRAAKADFLTKCMIRSHELGGLRLALVEGRVDGKVYEGDCACFVGTLANVAQCRISDLGIPQNPSSPVERLFLAINVGDTPETNAVSKVVVGWLDELIAFAAAFNAPEVKTQS